MPFSLYVINRVCIESFYSNHSFYTACNERKNWERLKLLMQTYNFCVMSKILKIVLMLIFCACSSEHSKMAVDIERIPVEVHKVTSDASLFIDP